MTRRESLIAMLGAVLGVRQAKGRLIWSEIEHTGEAVGIDTDGSIKPVELLSYWPATAGKSRTRVRMTVNRQWEIVELFGPRILGR